MNAKLSTRLSFDERENKILDAATSLFSQNGFKGTTTKAIAEEADINEALLYRHFPTKDDLYTALVQRKFEEWKTQVLPILEKTLEQPLLKGLFEIAKNFVSRNRDCPDHFRIMLFSSLENHHLSQLFFEQKPPLIEFLENFFKEKMKRKEMKKQDPDILARTFLGIMLHHVLLRDIFKAKNFYSHSETEELKSFVQIFVEGVLP